MAKLQVGNWQGVDVLSLIMGGQDNKAKAAGEALQELASFMQKLNALNEGIAAAIDGAASALQSGLESLLNINPLSAFIESVIRTIKELIEELKGVGVYFLDMNTVSPPMWTGGTSIGEVALLAKIDKLQGDYDKKLVEITTKGTAAKEEEIDELERLNNELNVETEKLSNLRGDNFGGTARYAQVFNDSLDDPGDPARPLIPDSSPASALFIMFGHSSLASFFELYKAFSSLINNFFPPSVDGIGVIRNLRAKYISTGGYEAAYTKMATLFQEAAKVAKHHGKYPEGASENLHGLIIKDQRDRESIEVTPVYFSSDSIAKAKTPITQVNPSNDTNLPREINRSKLVMWEPGVYFSGNDASTHKFTFVSHKTRVEDLGLNPSNLYHENGSVWYVPNLSAVETFKNTRNIIWDEVAPERVGGSVFLSWDYPRINNVVTNFFRGVDIEWNRIYVFRELLRNNEPFEDLRTQKNIGTIKEDSAGTIKIFSTDAYYGFRTSFIDNEVPEIDANAKEGVFAIDYMVSAAYTKTTKFYRYSQNTREVLIYEFPLEMVCYDPDSTDIQDVIINNNARRSRYIKALEEDIRSGGTVGIEAKKKKALISEKFSAGSDIGIVPIYPIDTSAYSNIARVTIPLEFDRTSSNPPDWWRTPHILKMIPQLFQVLDNISKFLDMIENYITDIFGLIGDLADSLKSEISYYINKLTQFAETLARIVQALSALSAGIYAMPMAFESGGINAIRKALAMSLLGNLEDVPWGDNPQARSIFLAGPPPFDDDDYIGGYALIGASADFLNDFVESLSNIGQWDEGLQEYINNIKDTFSKAYDDFRIAARLKKADATSDGPAPGSDGYSSEVRDEDYLNAHPFVDVESDGPNEVSVIKLAHLNGAVASLNSGDTAAMAGHIYNFMAIAEEEGVEFDSSSVGAAMEDLRNYDCSVISGIPCFDKLKAAFNSSSSLKMKEAAECLRYTNYRIPNEIELFQCGAGSTNYTTFKLTLGEILALAVTGIPTSTNLRGIEVEVSPFDGVADYGLDLEKDTYQTGLNVAVWSNWDTRLLENVVYNASWEVSGRNYEWENEVQYDLYDNSVYNDSWEVSLWEG